MVYIDVRGCKFYYTLSRTDAEKRIMFELKPIIFVTLEKDASLGRWFVRGRYLTKEKNIPNDSYYYGNDDWRPNTRRDT